MLDYKPSIRNDWVYQKQYFLLYCFKIFLFLKGNQTLDLFIITFNHFLFIEQIADCFSSEVGTNHNDEDAISEIHAKLVDY